VIMRSMLTCCLLLLAAGPARPSAEVTATHLPIFLYTVAKSYHPLAWLYGEERFSSDAAIFIRDGNGKRALLPDFASSADAAVSFDGKRVLFSGKARGKNSWQIWEVPLEGGAPRPITSGPDDHIRPLYLPEDRVVYARKISGRFVIETIDIAGGKPLALTYIPANAIPSDVLQDGRIVFSAGFPLGTATTPEVYTVYSDGSGVESYRCDHGEARHSAKQSSSGDLVFASAPGLSRFTSARAEKIRISGPDGDYGGGFVQTASGEWLISWRPEAAAPFRLVQWKEGAESLNPVLAEPGIDVVQPVLVVSRTVPNRHPSGLHDWPNANLLCLNAYTSKYKIMAGSIQSVRFYSRDSDGNAKLLGSAPVERDGSFFVQVPGEQPLQVELLDSSGKTLKRESGFFWMRRGEQRGCVGCHAGPETSPENAVPMILLKSTTPADLTGASVQNASGGN
jgi:Hydrazine synthase alpha subunit middle domain